MKLEYECSKCGHRHALEELAWRCALCGSLLDLAGFEPRFPTLPFPSNAQRPGLWRYSGALPLPAGADLSMGEGSTPVVGLPGYPGVAVKLDYLMPTGSFKDRGAVLLAALGQQLGVGRMLTDSSGNAGAALAAYAARAEVACDVYVPSATSPAKVGQLTAYGATVHRVPGSRADTADAAAEAADGPGVLYASHVYNPFFFHGTKTYVLELWEVMEGRLPQTLLLPVGNGTLVLGAYLAFCELQSQGLLECLPRIVGVQAAACAPLAAALAGDEHTVTSRPVGPTIAEGIAIGSPPRGDQVLSAIRATGGDIVTVTEDQVHAAHLRLARMGFYVEPTAAVCMAALIAGGHSRQTSPAGADHFHTVVPLCGSGLKTKPPSGLG